MRSDTPLDVETIQTGKAVSPQAIVMGNHPLQRPQILCEVSEQVTGTMRACAAG